MQNKLDCTVLLGLFRTMIYNMHFEIMGLLDTVVAIEFCDSIPDQTFLNGGIIILVET